MKYTLIGFTLMICLILGGCASSGPSNYALYAETQAKIAQAHAVAETARFNALSEIAKTGDSAAKVAAVLSIQLSGNSGGNQRNQQVIAAPEDWDQKLLKWAGVILPTVTQGLAIGAQIHAANTQKQIAVTQSNNAAATAQSTNNTFAAMSGNMATSNAAIAKSGFDAVGAAGNALTTVATSGLTAVQNTASSGFTATQNTAAAGLNATQNVATAGLTSSTTLGTAGINGVNTASNAGLTAATTLGTAGITGVNTAANAGITGINNAVANGNTLTNNVATGFTSSLQAAINKLTGTITTTTTSTTNTTTTTNNVCPVGQIFTNGVCN